MFDKGDQPLVDQGLIIPIIEKPFEFTILDPSFDRENCVIL